MFTKQRESVHHSTSDKACKVQSLLSLKHLKQMIKAQTTSGEGEQQLFLSRKYQVLLLKQKQRCGATSVNVMQLLIISGFLFLFLKVIYKKTQVMDADSQLFTYKSRIYFATKLT